MTLRIGVLPDSTLVARKLADIRLVICASPDYLRRYARLYGHAPGVTWPLLIEGVVRSLPVRGVYRANNGEAVRDAAMAGLGLAQLPEFIIGEALRSGALVAVLEGFATRAGAAYAVHPAHRQRSASVRALTDYLVACFDGPNACKPRVDENRLSSIGGNQPVTATR